MTIFRFSRGRAKSRYADRKAVNGFEQVVDNIHILTEQQRVDGAAKIVANENPTADDIERLGDLLNGG